MAASISNMFFVFYFIVLSLCTQVLNPALLMIINSFSMLLIQTFKR